MPIKLQKEPATFASQVREPGTRFLSRCRKPTAKQWKTHGYWTRCAGELHSKYGGICAYSCHVIPSDTGWRTTEHFKPKDAFPSEAYEWNNYRLVCGMLNGRKGLRRVLDPFELTPNKFCIRFPALLVTPCDSLNGTEYDQVMDTITILGLNDEGSCLQRRIGFVMDYCKGLVDFALIERDAPFLASEIKRQGLVHNMAEIMSIRLQ